jgi:release factor glutamine methyltransferase
MIPGLAPGMSIAAARRGVAQAFHDSGLDSPDLDARLLVGHALGLDHSALASNGERQLNMQEVSAISDLAVRRLAHEPVARIIGRKEFWGLEFSVTPATLVPRPDTETLVDWGLELLARPHDSTPQVVDLGTGSGAVALALKWGCAQAAVCGVDLSADALAVAQGNALSLGLAVEWQLGDWWQPLHARLFDLVVSNPPYVAAGDPHLPALRHEPALALLAGSDGLVALRRIVQGAPAHLRRGGWLLLEHGHAQAGAVGRLLAEAGFDEVQTRADLAGRPRCTGGRLTHA